ncbi:hypothetical protein JCM11754A_08100 [Isoptericola variabilis]
MTPALSTRAPTTASARLPVAACRARSPAASTPNASNPEAANASNGAITTTESRTGRKWDEALWSR